MGGFEGFVSVMGGVLDVAGVPGFLANPEAKQSYTDHQSSALRAFLDSWWKQYPGCTVGVAELLPLAEHLELGKGGRKSRGIRLGKLLCDHRDRVIIGFTIEAAGPYQGSQQYCLRRREGNGMR